MRFNKLLLLSLLVLGFNAARGQNEDDYVKFLQAGQDDAAVLIEAYVTPMIEGLSYGLNGGWFSTAKAHKPLGFDLGFTLNAVFIPTSKNYFKPNNLDLSLTELISPASGEAPTITGPAEESVYTTTADINGDGTAESFSWNGPEGLDFKDVFKVNGVLAPTAQLGIGIFKNTDLKVRYMPEITVSQSSVKLFGIGIMHDIKQHFPGIKLMPFDLSVLVGYSNIQGTTGLEGEFEKPANDTRRQQVAYTLDGWVAQAVISKKFSFISLYGSLGYNSFKTTSDVTGSYIILSNNPATTADDIVFTDPVSITFKSSTLVFTGGFRLNMGPVYFSLDYSLQEYNRASAGLGFTIR